MSEQSLVKSSIDFDQDGNQSGYLTVPCPNNQSAWGVVKIPIASIKNGTGPTVLLTAGIHGDEYEGQVSLSELCHLLNYQDMRGQIIIIPSLNTSASQAGTRLSPIDNLDMNRSFPGDAHGSLTQKISHYVATVLLPKVEYVIDFHSGGRSLEFLPVIIMHDLADEALHRRTRSALEKFGGNFGLILEEIDCVGMFDTYCENQDKVFLTTELSGGCDINVDSINTVKSGLKQFLTGIECLSNHDALADWYNPEPQDLRLFEVPASDYYVHADEHGVFEPLIKLGEDIQTGQLIGKMHQLATINASATLIHAKVEGTLIAKRALAQSVPGDCLFVIGSKHE